MENGADIHDRFDSLLTHPLSGRRSTFLQTERAPLSEAEQIAFRLHEWAGSHTCKDEFLPLLDEMVKSIDEEVTASVGNHALVAHAIGRRDALRALKALFLRWAGTVD